MILSLSLLARVGLVQAAVVIIQDSMHIRGGEAVFEGLDFDLV
jgi:hypothetical protein